MAGVRPDGRVRGSGKPTNRCMVVRALAAGWFRVRLYPVRMLSVCYLYPIVSHPGCEKSALVRKPQQETVMVGVRGESPPPPPISHTSRNPPGCSESPPLQASRVLHYLIPCLTLAVEIADSARRRGLSVKYGHGRTAGLSHGFSADHFALVGRKFTRCFW